MFGCLYALSQCLAVFSVSQCVALCLFHLWVNVDQIILLYHLLSQDGDVITCMMILMFADTELGFP